MSGSAQLATAVMAVEISSMRRWPIMSPSFANAGMMIAAAIIWPPSSQFTSASGTLRRRAMSVSSGV